MIFLTDSTVVAGGKTNKIIRWEVWWRCPFGITPILDEAVGKCAAAGLDPDMHVLPVPTAITDGGEYEPWLR